MPTVVHTTTSNSTSVTIPATTAGNTLVVCIMGASGSGTPSVSTVTLGGSATGWVSQISEVGASNEAFAAIYTNSAIAGGQTALVVSGTNLDVASGYGGIVVLEISGAAAVDKKNKATATSGSWSVATGTLSAAGEIVIGCCNPSAGSVVGPSTPWTNATPSGGFSIAGWQVVTPTTTVTYSGTCSATFPYAACIVSIEAAATVSGTVQPRATVPVPRRKPARAVWQGISGQAYVAVPPPPQQPAPAPRRKPSRALVRFTPVVTVNAAPTPPVAGTVQPRAVVPAPRRLPGRGLWHAITGQAYVAVPAPLQQPAPAPRRRPGRVIWRGIQGAPGPVYVAVRAPRQLYRTPPRRRAARAVVQFTPVATVNTLGPRALLIALASQAGTDDYGNPFPQGILATAGQIAGPEFLGQDFIISTAGICFYSGTPAADMLLVAISALGGYDGYGNQVIQGFGSYGYNPTNGAYAITLSASNGIEWWSAPTQAGPYTQQMQMTGLYNSGVLDQIDVVAPGHMFVNGEQVGG